MQARRKRPRASGVTWLLRIIAVGYVLGLVALPVVSVVGQTFSQGVGPVIDTITSPDFVAALKLTLIVAGIAGLKLVT